MLKNKTKENSNHIKLPKKKLFAFTLAEILLVFAFIGVIATAYTVDSRSKVETIQNKLLIYNLFKSLDLASREIARTNSDVVPDDGVTFCNNLADIMNTVGEVKCDSSLVNYGTDFTTPNFVASNGMRFYNVAAAPTADISDASKLISTSELQAIHELATNKANSEIDGVMNVIASEAESSARSRLPARNYNVTTKYEKYNTADPQMITAENGSYYVYFYNYSAKYEHEGRELSASNEKVYNNDLMCYEIINALNEKFFQDMGSATYCSNIKNVYNETVAASSTSNYNALKTLIDDYYEKKESKEINDAINEAKSDGRKMQEKEKLYQKYYNQYYQSKFKEKIGSLPTVHNIYVDINGSRGKSVLNEDVFLFIVRRDGKALPAKNSDLSNTTNIISARYFAKNNTPLSDKLTFRAAACSTATFAESDYSTNGYCEGYSVDTSNCPRKNACYYKISQPKSMWSLF